MNVIQLENVSKRYWLRHRAPDRRLMEVLYDAGRRACGGTVEAAETGEEFWALRDISLTIGSGEVVGLLGRNGAGKSTLLKLISRIMAPTTGRIGVRGRLGCLIEVGSGFHPELTGRENIFLNGAILGMSRREIRQKFEQIVAFAEVEAFLDTPVKHYSSGMFVRLAFSVAALLDPEVLIVDEVLSVGDASFQKKSLAVIQDSVQRGATCLIVSHHLPSIADLCRRAVLLESGRIAADGPPEDVIRQYLATARREGAELVWTADSAPGDESIRLLAARIRQSQQAEPAVDVDLAREIFVQTEYKLNRDFDGLTSSVTLKDQQGTIVLVSTAEPVSQRQGRHLTECAIPAHLLNHGRYVISVAVGRGWNHPHAVAEDCLSLYAHETATQSGLVSPSVPGVIHPRLVWRTETV